MDLSFKKALGLVLCLAVFGHSSILAQKPPTEYEVKAAFLFNFLKYVEWPAKAFPEANKPWAIGVLGDDPFGGALENAVAAKTINERKITVRRAAQLEDLKECHLLFICQSEKSRAKRILTGLPGTATLTVSEFESFAEQGGMINFTMAANKVRFEINLKAAQQAGLKINFKLLNLAKIVSP